MYNDASDIHSSVKENKHVRTRDKRSGLLSSCSVLGFFYAIQYRN